MGTALNGLFLSFQPIATLGGMGDLGMGGVVNIQTSRLLGQGKEPELRSLLASARTAFLFMAVLVMAGFFALSPWLPQMFRFEHLNSVGSLRLLFITGGVGAGLLVLNSYFSNLNYGCGNLTWSVVPTFVLMQLGILGHWLLARANFPLWVQYLPYVLVSFFSILLYRHYVLISHPSLATVRRLAFDKKPILSLLNKSFWVYFYCLGSGICLITDRLLINAGFGSDRVPSYLYNYKLCELASFVVVSASLVSMPKITKWLSSPESSERERAAFESQRLNKFQTFLGCAAALIYLEFNDFFMGFWLGPNFKVPLLLQAAFAANLAVSASGQVGFELASRCNENGIRVGGIAVISAALLNLSLSYTAMKLGSITGIAIATVVAQSCLVLYLGKFTSKNADLSWWRLSVKPWLLAAASVSLGFLIKTFAHSNSSLNILFIVIVYCLFLFWLARLLSIGLEDLKQEAQIIRSILKSRASSASVAEEKQLL